MFDTFDPTVHDEKYKYEEDGEILCCRLFSKLILLIDAPVTVGEYQKSVKCKLTRIGHEGSIELYTSASSDPKYVDEKGCCFVGYILSAGHGFLLNETVNVMMRF